MSSRTEALGRTRDAAFDHGTWPTVFAGLLDWLACGVVLIRADGRIVMMNRAAKRVVGAADGLVSCNGRLAAACCRDNRDLRLAIAAAAAGDGGGLLIRRPSGRQACQVFTMPLAPAVAVLISDPERAMAPPAGTVARLYGLSPAETAVALETAKGSGLGTVAATLGISRNTAKTHLSRVFHKTGTSRQAELARLLAGPAILRGDVDG